jgi:two-component system CheB/CheR fusion protein
MGLKKLTKDDTEGEKKREINSEYIRALIETIRGPFLILDSKLRVMDANETFYTTFKVSVEETKKELVYELGNGQWNISTLKKLLEEILPTKKVVRDYEVEHAFPVIGEKVMLLNAKQVDSMALILLAFEDITVERRLEKKLTEYTRGLEAKVAERTGQLAERVKELEELNQSMVGREVKMVELKKEIEDLRKNK